MKTKIILLCIIATITLSSCTGKEPPAIANENNSSQESSHTDEIPSQESSTTNNVIPEETISTQGDSSQESGSSKDTPISNPTNVSSNELTEMPQEILDYCRDNDMKVTIESLGYYSETDANAIANLYSLFYVNERDKTIIGVILDLTDEENPAILYHHPENALYSAPVKNDGSYTMSTMGKTCIVKFNDDNSINEFSVADHDMMDIYGDLLLEINSN